MKICVLEDDAPQAELLTGYLVRFREEHPGFEYTLEIYDRAVGLLDAFHQDADLLLLDIQVPDMLGIEAARRIRETDENVMIIFVTNLAQYAIDGYSVNAFDYILKPVNYFAFAKKLERAFRVLSHRASNVTLELKNKTGSRRILVDSITYIEISAHEILVHTDTETIRQWGTLSKLEEDLRDAHFARCNASFLVNLKYVQSICKNQVTVGGDSITISRTFRKDFLNAMAQYQGGSL